MRPFILIIVVFVAARIVVDLLHEHRENLAWVGRTRPIQVDDLSREHLLFVIIVELVVEESLLETGRVHFNLV